MSRLFYQLSTLVDAPILTYAEKSELSSLLAARRGVLNQITSSMSQRDMNPMESKKVDDLYTKVAELDQRIAQLENAQSADIPASDPNATTWLPAVAVLWVVCLSRGRLATTAAPDQIPIFCAHG